MRDVMRPPPGAGRRIAVVGVGPGPSWLAPPAAAALERADVVAGAPRHLALAPATARAIPLGRPVGGSLVAALDAVAAAAEEGRVCVLASGDPGFFGILRSLADRFGPARLEVHPAPSSVAVAFARLAVPWDDAVVVSAHGRPLAAAAAVAARAAKAAVLTSPDSPPEALGKAMLAAGVGERRVVVCSDLGAATEAVVETDLAGLAAGRFGARSVVVLLAGDPVAATASLAWGRPEADFEHRRGMVTKAEVRAVVLAKLELPRQGVLWDVGAGSGSIAVEAAGLVPGLSVHALERDPDEAERARRNATRHGVAVTVVTGAAPDALAALPTPDRAFVGGGGLAVLDAVLGRMAPGGMVVATYAALDRAAAAAERLGDLVQVAVSRGDRLPDGGLRLVAENPVFVAWGPCP